jgi:hypothetical protein
VAETDAVLIPKRGSALLVIAIIVIATTTVVVFFPSGTFLPLKVLITKRIYIQELLQKRVSLP